MLPQEAEERQERQAEHGGVLALDTVEELRAQAFQAVGTNARERGLAFKG